MIKIVSYNELSQSFYEDRADSLFYTEPWLRVLQQTYGYQWMVALDSLTEHFILFAVLDNLAGKKVISLPFSDYTPINTSNCKSLPGLLKAIQQHYQGYRVILKTELSAENTELSSLGTPTRHAYCHRIATHKPDQIAQSASFRRGVKKAEKAKVTIQIRTDETALSTFYEMYHDLRLNKFGSIPQPYRFFQNIHQVFIAANQGFILEAKHQNIVIASLIILEHRNTLYYKFGSSKQDTLSLRPNNLLFQWLIDIAVERKLTAIDLGLSGADSSYDGLVKFKESMGGIRYPITYFTITPKTYNEYPEKQFKIILTSLTQTIVEQQLDVAATSELSSTIYPYFA